MLVVWDPSAGGGCEWSHLIIGGNFASRLRSRACNICTHDQISFHNFHRLYELSEIKG